MHDRLTMSPLPTDPRGLVVLLHGGAAHGPNPVDQRSLALRRTGWMFRAISEELVASGIGVGLLRFSVKGWNARPGQQPSPVRDARLAVNQLHAAYPDLPIVLIGHSMGARAAAWAADEPGVVGVVGLAPWFPKDDRVDAFTGKHLVAAQGRRDRITSPRHTRVFVERAAEVAAEARFIDMGGLGHYMIRGADRWNRIAVAESRRILDWVREDR